ncbi:MAG: histidinol-phosphatase [Candidatus Acidiferrales bacterium]
MPATSFDQMLDLALTAAREAGEIALRHFRASVHVETKADRSPVTIADREAEDCLRRRIEARFPEHAILGEEFGAVREGSAYRWLLDPIDGTQSFIRGSPLWGVMVALEHEGESQMGVLHFPALAETVWARRGGGAWWSNSVQPGFGERRARVSSVARLEDATLLYTDPRGFAPAGREEEFQKLRRATKFERSWGDCYGHALVATGRAEIMLDPVLHEWDACALLPILEEAGGSFTDWRGARTTRGGSGVSTNGALFGAVQKLLRE